MKFQFLGTAAAEGIPAMFCVCENCNKSRVIGGRALRTRSQAIIDDKLLIDFPQDALAHILACDIHMDKVEHCIITHTHSDHFYAPDIRMLEPGFANMPDNYHLTFYGTDKVGKFVNEQCEIQLNKSNVCEFKEVKAFDVFMAGKYTITVLPAIHDPASGPVIYQISDGAKNVLYAHDTHYFDESVWEYWAKEKTYFHLVSLDCCNACKPLTYVGHMGLAENIQVRERMLKEGYADEKTIFVCNHFSHNGYNVVYDEFVPIAAKEGFQVSYDGMIIHL